MNVAAAAASAASTTNSVADKGLGQLAENFDNFLTILTTQLQYQDPLDPMDSSEFTQQLVQFTGVEQSVAQNKNLEQIVAMLSGDKFLGAAGYIGKTVEATGDTTQLQKGVASWTYDLATTANSAVISIYNSAGQEVLVKPFEKEQGKHVFNWDGMDQNGVQVPDGQYTLSVDAKNFAGEAVGATMNLSGQVTGVEHTENGEVLMIGGLKIPVSAVTVVRETPAVL